MIGNIRAELKMTMERSAEQKNKWDLLEEVCHRKILQLETDGKAKIQAIKELKREKEEMLEDPAKTNRWFIEAYGNVEEMERELKNAEAFHHGGTLS